MDSATDEASRDELFTRFKKDFEEDQSHRKEWLREAKEDYEFSALRQWSTEDLEKLKSEGRPPIVFSRVNPIIRAIEGQEVNNRREARVIPRALGISKPHSIMSGAVQWFRDQSGADGEDSTAFRDMLICGEGWTDTRLDYEIDQDGTAVVDRLDPMEMFPDWASQKPNFRDARRMTRVRKMSLEDAQAMFPDADPEDLNAFWASDEAMDASIENAGSPYSADIQRNRNEDEDSRSQRVTIVERQWFEKQGYVTWLDPTTGQPTENNGDEFKIIKAEFDKAEIELEFVRRVRRVYKRAFLGGKVLSIGPTACPYQFSLKAMTCFPDRNKGLWFGLMREMRDPQRMTNKWLSQATHIINSNAAGGVMAEGGAFVDQEEAEEKWARPDSIIEMSPGALTAGKVQPKPMAQMPQGHFQLLQLAIDGTRAASGISLEFLGQREANQPGILEWQRRQSGIMMLGGIFEAYRQYREEQAKVMVSLITDYLMDERLIRISGDASATEYIPLIKDPGFGKYDIIIDDAPTSPNQKQVVFDIFSTLAPVVGQMMTKEMWMAVLENSPLPSGFIEQMREVMNPPPDPEQEAMKQLEMAMNEAMLQGQYADTFKDQAQAQNFLAQVKKNLADAQKKTVEAIYLPQQIANEQRNGFATRV